MTTRKIVPSMMIGLVGILFLVSVDWKIAAGVFLCLWGNNLMMLRGR